MQKSFLAAALTLLIAGCGSGEDFSVTIKRSPAGVFMPFSTLDLSEAKALFPSLTVKRSRPSDDEVLYTIPGSNDRVSTIRFRFEPLDKAKQTAIHASVDVEPVSVWIGGKTRVLNEALLELFLRALLEQARGSWEDGAEADRFSRDFTDFLALIAVGTNKELYARAKDIKDYPDAMARAMAKLEAELNTEEYKSDQLDQPMDDPERNLAKQEAAQGRAERLADRDLENAVRPDEEAARPDEEASRPDEEADRPDEEASLPHDTADPDEDASY